MDITFVNLKTVIISAKSHAETVSFRNQSYSKENASLLLVEQF